MYDDIINYKYTGSKKHIHMSIYNRSAQFAPFSALTGYDDMIDLSNKETINKKELSENEKEIINNKLILNQKLIITYFIKDKEKEGGKYIKEKGIITKIDKINKTIYFNNKKINIEDIHNITDEKSY